MIQHNSRNVQEWLPRQAMHVACLPVPRHDGSDHLLRLTDMPGGRLGNLDSLFADFRIGTLVVEMVLLRVMHALGRPFSRPRPGTSRSFVIVGDPKINLQRVFFARELLG